MVSHHSHRLAFTAQTKALEFGMGIDMLITAVGGGIIGVVMGEILYQTSYHSNYMTNATKLPGEREESPPDRKLYWQIGGLFGILCGIIASAGYPR